MKTLILLGLIALTGCTRVSWYVYNDKGKMTQKVPRFIDYQNNCVQFEDTEESLYVGAVFMKEKIHMTSLTELVEARNFRLCQYGVTSK